MSTLSRPDYAIPPSEFASRADIAEQILMLAARPQDNIHEIDFGYCGYIAELCEEYRHFRDGEGKQYPLLDVVLYDALAKAKDNPSFLYCAALLATTSRLRESANSLLIDFHQHHLSKEADEFSFHVIGDNGLLARILNTDTYSTFMAKPTDLHDLGALKATAESCIKAIKYFDHGPILTTALYRYYREYQRQKGEFLAEEAMNEIFAAAMEQKTTSFLLLSSLGDILAAPGETHDYHTLAEDTEEIHLDAMREMLAAKATKRFASHEYQGACGADMGYVQMLQLQTVMDRLSSGKLGR